MRSRRAPAVVGLLAAWGGTALLVSPAALSLAQSSVLLKVLGQGALWLLCATVIAIVLFWERRTLDSIWLRRIQWQSLAWAAALIAVHLFLVFPLTEWIRTSIGLPGYATGMESALNDPAWLRLIGALTAGVVEEVLFRGFAVTRLRELSGSLVTAVIVASAVFAALHLPVWGTGPSLAFFVGGVATTAFFVWRRDLLAMIVAHAAIDTWGLVVTPGFSRWWL